MKYKRSYCKGNGNYRKGRKMTLTIPELKKFFDTYEQIEYRIKEIAPFCTNITSREEVTGFSCYDGKEVCIRVWNQDCGNDAYEFPLEYLSMEDNEIKECERKKAEEQKKIAEEEGRKEKKRRERQERMEYERLKKKFESKSSKRRGVK